MRFFSRRAGGPGLLLGLLLTMAAARAQVTPPATQPPIYQPGGSAPAQAESGLRTRADSVNGLPWSLHFQQTIISQGRNAVNFPYGSRNSLLNSEPAALSLTTTLFIGRRLWRGAGVFFNPEVAGGRGLSGAFGVAGFPNGETFRVGAPEPVVYLARLYVRQLIDLGDDEVVDDDQNQLGGPQPVRYLGLTLGKFSIADFFDQNSYSHDPRTQFMNWSLMSAGGWDYPANVRGYTVGGVAEYVRPNFAVRVATSLMPTTANGPKLDYDFPRAAGSVAEVSRSHRIGGHEGTVRLLGFYNVAAMGAYRLARTFFIDEQGQRQDTVDVSSPNVRRAGRTKLGFVLGFEQELTDESGIFGRLSYNDGRNETWAFTEIDRSLSLGYTTSGRRWRRPADRLGVAGVINGLSPDHRAYLAAGGLGFIIGDGALNYAPEYIAEVYYGCFLPRFHLTLTPDYQFILNPAYNRDRRGPLHVWALRAHVEF